MLSINLVEGEALASKEYNQLITHCSAEGSPVLLPEEFSHYRGGYKGRDVAVLARVLDAAQAHPEALPAVIINSNRRQK
jgi:hypothetical protein